MHLPTGSPYLDSIFTCSEPMALKVSQGPGAQQSGLLLSHQSLPGSHILCPPTAINPLPIQASLGKPNSWDLHLLVYPEMWLAGGAYRKPVPKAPGKPSVLLNVRE